MVGLVVVTAILSGVLAVALTRQTYCGEYDIMRMRRCTALGRHDLNNDDPRHVWTDDEYLYSAWPDLKIYARWPLPRFERVQASRHILRPEVPSMDCLGRWRHILLVARALLVLATGRVVHGYPDYPAHRNAWELGSWNGRSWAGNEMTCWEADFASICTGRAWHIHLYTDGGP